MRTTLIAPLAALLLLPIAAAASPLAGRWDGVFHGGHGDTGIVLGRGHVTVYDGKSHGGAHGARVLPAGARYDLAREVTI